MKKVALVALFALLLVGLGMAQSTAPVFKVDGVHSYAYDGASARYGASIWDNDAWSGWFWGMGPADVGYMYLDWGSLPDQGNTLPDEVVDGFMFSYATNGTLGGLTWAMYFFDAYTGWGDLSVVQEAGFLFTGLPDATGLPPGYWGWYITVDLEGSGYEFLVADRGSSLSGLGVGGVNYYYGGAGTYTGPVMTLPPFMPLSNPNGDTGTEDAFDIFDPSGNYTGTYWFGGYPPNPYASFVANLFGDQDPAVGTVYMGNGLLTGNVAGLYCTGSWTNGGSVHFMLRSNGMTQTHALLANTTFNWPLLYLPAYDVTLVPKMPFLATLTMAALYAGDFRVYDVAVGAGIAGATIYLQGGISNYFSGGALLPIDLSRNIVRT